MTPTPSDSTITPSTVEDIDLAALPPPPDFLLDTTGPPDESLPPPPSPAAHRDEPLLPPPPPGSANGAPVSIPERSLKVADAVKTLNEIRHQPASPGVVRRAQSMRETLPAGQAANAAAGLLAKGVAALGTTPKARRPIDAHHAATLSRNAANRTASPVNHARTLPKHLPSHPVDAVRFFSSSHSCLLLSPDGVASKYRFPIRDGATRSSVTV